MEPTVEREVVRTLRASLGKQDVPEVEAEIAFLLGVLGEGRVWTGQAEKVLREELEAARRTLAPGQSPPEDLVLAILGSLYAVLRRPVFPPSVVQEATERLLGAPGGLGRAGLGDPQAIVLAARARRDLSFWFERRAEERVDDLKKAVRSALGALSATDPQGDTESGAAQPAAVSEAVDARTGVVNRSIVDTWAYRTFVAGGVLAASIAGAGILVVDNNPPKGPDSKTTPFCRWAHGRPIAVDRAVRILDAYYAAVAAGDADGAKRAWPLLDAQTVKGQAGPFEQVVVGIPPFHNGCRSGLKVRGV